MVGEKSPINTKTELNMRFLEYLFFKYYYFQVRVGDEDIAEYSALLFICFIIELIYGNILAFYFFFIPSSNYHSLPSVYWLIILFILSFFVLYFLLVHKHKYEKILEENEDLWKGKKNLGAVLFAVFPFVVFFFELYIKMLMNEGRI